MAKDLYETLGVARTASEAEIKTAYRKLARKLHPDVNPGDTKAEERFKEVTAAFEVLSDPERRKVHDEFGAAGAQFHWDPAKAAQFRAYQRQAQGGGSPFGSSGADFDLGDLFGQFFGQGGRGGGPRRADPNAPRAGEDIEDVLRIGLKEAVLGGTRTIQVTHRVSCTECSGTGARGGRRSTCPTCMGQGKARTGRGGLGNFSVCSTCGGSGWLGEKCRGCDGAGARVQTTRLDVKIPAGIDDGGKVRLPEKGTAGSRGGKAGDLLLKIEIEEHPLCRRDGDDLEFTLPLSIGEAMFGGEVTVPTFDGPVDMRIPAGSQSGRKLRLRGRGVPHLREGGRGDLYVVLAVRVPAADSPEARKAAELLDGLQGGDVRAGLQL